MKANTIMLKESVTPMKLLGGIVHDEWFGLILFCMGKIRITIAMRTTTKIKHDSKLVLASFEISLSKLSGIVTKSDTTQMTKCRFANHDSDDTWI
jgi:hypothetical protein